MFKMTPIIREALEASKHDLKVFVDEGEKSSNVWLQFGVNGHNYRIKFISRDDDNDVAVRVYGLIRVEGDDQKNKALVAINDLHNRFRFVRFYIDDDGDINVGYDYMMRDQNPATSAEEAVIRFVDIIEEAYPALMKAIWS